MTWFYVTEPLSLKLYLELEKCPDRTLFRNLTPCVPSKKEGLHVSWCCIDRNRIYEVIGHDWTKIELSRFGCGSVNDRIYLFSDLRLRNPSLFLTTVRQRILRTNWQIHLQYLLILSFGLENIIEISCTICSARREYRKRTRCEGEEEKEGEEEEEMEKEKEEEFVGI